jgi:hypothetical protein
MDPEDATEDQDPADLQALNLRPPHGTSHLSEGFTEPDHKLLGFADSAPIVPSECFSLSHY